MRRYSLFSSGDANGFFALFLDNLVNLVTFYGILTMVFGFPGHIITQKMIPGTALGVMVGDLLFTWLAFRLAKKTGKDTITAIPLGLDTPSTIGIAFAVIGPAFLHYKANLGAEQGAIMAWYIGVSVVLWMALVKFISSFFGNAIQRIVPTAALIGSLAGVGVVWLAAYQFFRLMGNPSVGLISLSVVLLTLMSPYRLPAKFPGAAAAVLLGAIVYYAGMLGIPGIVSQPIHLTATPSLPSLPLGVFSVFMGDALRYLPIAIPFGLLTIIGGINVTQGARIVGDDYNTRTILLTDSLATLIGGLFGGVAQSTAYIGHSAYKKMGARAGYTLLTGILIGLGAYLGVIEFLVHLIPEVAVAPILIFIGFEIASLAYSASGEKHSMAVTFSIIPAILNYGYIQVKGLYEPVMGALQNLGQKYSSLQTELSTVIPPFFHGQYKILEAMGQGYILTAMIWGATAAYLADGKARHAVVALATGGVLAFFGVIHSATSTGEIYLPWSLPAGSNIPYHFSAAYLLSAAAILVMAAFSRTETEK